MIVVFNKRPPNTTSEINSMTWIQLICRTCTWKEWTTGLWSIKATKQIAEGIRKQIEESTPQ